MGLIEHPRKGTAVAGVGNLWRAHLRRRILWLGARPRLPVQQPPYQASDVCLPRAEGAEGVCLCSLGIDWYGRSTRFGLPGAAWAPLQALTALTALRFVMYGRRLNNKEPHLKLSQFTRLRRLGLPGCCDHGLALSLMAPPTSTRSGGARGGLGSGGARGGELPPRAGASASPAAAASITELDLSYAWLTVTPELVVQLAGSCPRLTALDVSHARWSGSAAQFVLPGDALLQGLAALAPQLRVLRMAGVPTHGTGMRPGSAPGTAAGLQELQELVLCCSQLLKSRLRELGSLHHLRSLTLTGVSSEEFLASTKVGGYLGLSALTALSELRILAPNDGRRAGGPAGDGNNVAGAALPLQPGPLPHDLAAVEGEPMDDDWVPVEHAQPPPHAAVVDDDGQVQAGGAGPGIGPGGVVGAIGEALAAAHGPNGWNMWMAALPAQAQAQLQHLQAMAGAAGGGGGGVGAAAAQLAALGAGGAGMGAAGAGAVVEAAAAFLAPAHGWQAGPSKPPADEPHMHFVGGLARVQVLVLTCVSSSAACLRHISGLPQLRVLALRGRIVFGHDGLMAARRLQLPALQSLQLLGATFPLVAQTRGDDRPGDSRSTSTLSARSPPSAGPASTSSHASTSSAPSTSAAAGAGDGGAAAGGGVRGLLLALGASLPQLEHLELGDCHGLTEDALSAGLNGLPRLRYLVLHGQPLPRESVTAVLAGRDNLQSFASWRNSAAVQIADGLVPLPGGGRRASRPVPTCAPWPSMAQRPRGRRPQHHAGASEGASDAGVGYGGAGGGHGGAAGYEGAYRSRGAGEEGAGASASCDAALPNNFFAECPRCCSLQAAPPRPDQGFVLTRWGAQLAPHPGAGDDAPSLSVSSHPISPTVGRESLWAKFTRKGLAVNTFDEVIDTSGGTLKRSLHGWQLMLLGVGTMVGAGVFVTTGQVAREMSGPAVIVSYLFAGLSCILSALCYAEYSCDIPLAGGAFNFITVTFGEFAGWLVACNLFVEWTLANAAVAKGFTNYLAALLGVPKSFFVLNAPDLAAASNTGTWLSLELDWMAVVFMLVLTAVMLLGTSESAAFQNASVGVYLALVALIIGVGATKVETDNYHPFLPFGVSGIFAGASSIFFSFIGFDMVASMAEEAVDPARNLPLGILGSVGAAAAIYAGMSTVLVGMERYSELDVSAPFAAVFVAAGMPWVARLVAVGALLGCTNSNFGGLLGMSRIYVTMSRAGLLPASLSKLNARSVPAMAVIASGAGAAVLALLLDLSALADFVSMGTLVAYMTVCLGILWRRFYVRGETPTHHKAPLATLIASLCAAGLAAGLLSRLRAPVVVRVLSLCVCIGLTGALAAFPIRYAPPLGSFAVPLVPWVPALGMVINLFLIASLSPWALVFWACWMVVCVLMYLAYGLHHSQGEGRVRYERADDW
ncbi:hypothetical protein FOA52_001808 [Chlamydomonas sp. UWO 241]|nr:hypothetical protein FOA52_001808 [Chlamydomonas sp. UWO 241]